MGEMTLLAARGRAFALDGRMRWRYLYRLDGPRVLEQAWRDVDTGEIEWREIPMEFPECPIHSTPIAGTGSDGL